MNQDSRTKKEELKTYASLGLKRTLKSGSQRRRLVARGAQIILGSGQPDEPEIMVRRDQYLEVRMGVLAEQLKEARAANWQLSREALLDYLAPKVDREAYRRLLALSTHSARVDTAFLQTHSRRPTRAEQKIFQQPQPAAPVPTQAPANHWREDVLENVLGAIEEKRQNSSGRLQSIWAELVGTESAQQSSLEKVEGGVAWFRCFSSPLSYQLQRRADLPTKLALKLKRPVKQVRVLY